MICEQYPRLGHLLLAIAFTGACIFQAHGSEACLEQDPSAMVAKVVSHELSSANAQGRWMFTASYHKDGIAYVARKIQTDDGIISWIVSRDGIPLSGSELSSQQSELNRLISDPDYLERNRKAMMDDYSKINTLLADIPESVQFHCLKQTDTTAEIEFFPKPGYAPWNLEQRIIAGMSGTIHLDLKDMRLLEASGVLHSDVMLFLGFGKIYKGSAVSLKRAKTETAAWETTFISTHIRGQVFFLKTIAQDGDEVRSDYCPVRNGLHAQDALPYLSNPVCTPVR